VGAARVDDDPAAQEGTAVQQSAAQEQQQGAEASEGALTARLAGAVKAHAIKKSAHAAVVNDKASEDQEQALTAAVQHDLKVHRMGKLAEDTALYRVKNEAKKKEATNRAIIAKLEAEKAIEKAKVGAENHQRHMAEFANADTIAAAAGEAKKAAEKELEDTTEVSDKAARMSVLANKRAKAHTATYEELADTSEQEKANLELAMEEDAEAQKVLGQKKAEEANELEAERKVTALEFHTAQKSEETALAHERATECAEASADKHTKASAAAGAVHKDAAKAVRVHAAHVENVQRLADEKSAQAEGAIAEAVTAAQEAAADTAEEEEAPLPDKLEGALQLAKIAQGEELDSQVSESQVSELESQASE